MGGSLGSKVVNDVIRDNIDTLLEEFDIIHICGKGNVDENLKDKKGYVQFEYVNEELPDLMTAADYIISRAGANSIFEFLALKKPTLLIPLSRKASRGDQILNAESFRKEGYSLVLEEEDITRESFMGKVRELQKEKDKLIKNIKNGKGKIGNEAVVNVIMESIKK